MKVIIVGGGKVGTYLGSLLLSGGHDVTVIEERETEVQRLRSELPERSVLLGSGSDPEVLETAGVRSANVVAAVTGADETNLVVTNLARFEFRVPRVIARVNNPKNAWMFTPEMGVDVALNQADLIARLVAEEMSLGDMMTLLKLRKGQFSVVEEKVHPRSTVAGKALHEVQFPDKSVLIAIIRKGDLLVPRGELVLQQADEIIALVHASQVGDLAALLGAQRT